MVHVRDLTIVVVVYRHVWSRGQHGTVVDTAPQKKQVTACVHNESNKPIISIVRGIGRDRSCNVLRYRSRVRLYSTMG